MADHLGDRTSVSSSITEAEAYMEGEKKLSHDGSFVEMKRPEEMEMGSDIERAELLPGSRQPEKTVETAPSTARAAIIWMVVNTLATIGIVSHTHPSTCDPFR
jgi:solute carrier family 35 protein E3